MHADAFKIHDALVRQLVDDQFPEWAAMPLVRVASDGTDNALYRLGPDLCLRLPLRPSAVPQITKELDWLARLSPLPLNIPEPVARGAPAAYYPSPWGVLRWLDGETATRDTLASLEDAATVLAGFVSALWRADTTGAPAAGAHNQWRGVALNRRNAVTRSSIEGVADLFPAARLYAVWSGALNVPAWSGAPVWIHGDIHSGNLLATDGALSGVIDFGLMGVGDPAVDLLIGWSLLDGRSRTIFRETLGVDEATWLRGRGWALSTALVALAYYRDTNRFLADMSARVIGEVLGHAS